MEAHEDDVGVSDITQFVTSGLPDEGSLLDSLSEEREEVAANREVDIAIPGYRRVRLYARYRLLDGPEISAIGQKIVKEFRKSRYNQALYGSIDAFLAACVGIYYEEEEGGERGQLTVNGVPVTGYTLELARGLKLEDRIDPQNPARSIVLLVFGGNEVAIQAHNLKLGRWMTDTSVDVDEEFLGGNS
jgi:hypothetical protein